MKLQCDLQTLCQAVSDVSLAISSKPSIPALEGVLLVCDGQSLTLTGYDLDIGITTTIPILQGEEGAIILQAQLFGEMLKKMEADVVSIETDDHLMTTIVGERTRFHILGMAQEDYPKLPACEENRVFSIAQPVLKKMLQKTLFCTSMNSTVTALQGALFEVKEDLLTLVALDGYRIALCRESIESKQSFRFVAPSRSLGEIGKLLEEKDEEKVTRILLGRSHALFQIGSYRIVTRLLEGEFLSYQQALEGEAKTTLRAEVERLIQGVERISIIINPKNKTPVILDLQGQQMELSCESTIGRVQEKQEVDWEGENISIAFNNRYLLDALRHCDSERVRILFQGKLAPIKILPLEGDEFLYLILPVRLKENE